MICKIVNRFSFSPYPVRFAIFLHRLYTLNIISFLRFVQSSFIFESTAIAPMKRHYKKTVPLTLRRLSNRAIFPDVFARMLTKFSTSKPIVLNISNYLRRCASAKYWKLLEARSLTHCNINSIASQTQDVAVRVFTSLRVSTLSERKWMGK